MYILSILEGCLLFLRESRHQSRMDQPPGCAASGARCTSGTTTGQPRQEPGGNVDETPLNEADGSNDGGSVPARETWRKKGLDQESHIDIVSREDVGTKWGLPGRGRTAEDGETIEERRWAAERDKENESVCTFSLYYRGPCTHY